jgi:hypothetical protein
MIRSATFTSIAEAVVPETRAMSAEQWREFADVIEAALARRPPAMRRQLALFLKILNLLALLRHRRPLNALSLEQRTAFLSGIENSRLLLFRRGFWGIRTLVFMGYYARPGCAATLGYAAAARGWELRR